jgi:hypothetical protein
VHELGQLPLVLLRRARHGEQRRLDAAQPLPPAPQVQPHRARDARSGALADELGREVVFVARQRPRGVDEQPRGVHARGRFARGAAQLRAHLRGLGGGGRVAGRASAARAAHGRCKKREAARVERGADARAQRRRLPRPPAPHAR